MGAGRFTKVLPLKVWSVDQQHHLEACEMQNPWPTRPESEPAFLTRSPGDSSADERLRSGRFKDGSQPWLHIQNRLGEPSRVPMSGYVPSQLNQNLWEWGPGTDVLLELPGGMASPVFPA